jgi:exosortase
LVQTEISTARRNSIRLPSGPLWQLGILGALILSLYAPTLFWLVSQWSTDQNASHGFLVPLFSAFVIWQERDRLSRILPQPSWSGVVVLIAGLGVLILGRMGAERFLECSSLLLVLAGVVIVFLGWNLFRAVFLPWTFLLLMIPIPKIVLNQITFPLQLLASRVSAAVLEFLGVPVGLYGNVLQLATMRLNVEDACAGIRYLVALLTLAIIYGYLMERRLWVKWLLALASLPIAIAANDVRIIGTGLLVQHWPEAADGFYHSSWGLLTFAVFALLMLYTLHALVGFVAPEKGRES